MVSQLWRFQQEQKEGAMPRNIDGYPGLFQKSGLRTKRRRLPLIPTMLIAVGILVTFLFETIPNWHEFSSNISQFPALWSVERNRPVIIVLSVKVGSPMVIALILGLCLYLWYTVKPFLVDREGIPSNGIQQRVRLSNVMDRATNTDSPVPLSMQQPNDQQAGRSRGSSVLAPLPPEAVTSPPRVYHGVFLNRDHRRLHEREKLYWRLKGKSKKELSPHAAVLLFKRHERLYKAPGIKKRSSDTSTTSSLFPTGSHAGATKNHTMDANPTSFVSITLLKVVTLTLHVPDGTSCIVPLSPNSKRVLPLVYIASKRGEKVSRDKMLEDLFGHGRSDDVASPEKLGKEFSWHIKFLRKDIRDRIAQLNADRGAVILDPSLDIFKHKNKMWWLSAICAVKDIEMIEEQHRVIEEAKKRGLLVDTIPDFVYEACDRLIASYAGDFLEEIIQNNSDMLGPWIRRPYTLYRDYYLQAIWYAAEHERYAGQHYANEGPGPEDEAGRKERRKHWGRAAELYKTYALYACNSHIDLKVTFGVDNGTHGERVVMSESALQNSAALYGATGSTDRVEELYSAFSKHMKKISDKRWEPSQETLRVVQAAKERTNAYRILAQATQNELHTK